MAPGIRQSLHSIVQSRENMNAQELLPHDFLAQMRLEADPVADQAIVDILAEGFGQMQQLYQTLSSNEKLKALPPSSALRRYFETNAVLPEWADAQQCAIGQDVFRRFGIEITMLLFYVSLPAAYSCRHGAHVLVETGRLITRKGKEDRFAHRLMETAQFVLDVMEPGAFLPEGNGMEVALKIRLIHASIRYYLKSQGSWDVATYGEPINQEDMAGTLMSFSAMILEGLENMGAHVTPEEQEAYFHCWRIVGHLTGLRPELNPKNYADGLKLGFQVFNDQKGPSEDGEILIKALVDFVSGMLPHHPIKRKWPIMMIRYFVNKDLAGVLKFEKISVIERVLLDGWFRLHLFFHRLFQRHHYAVPRAYIGRTRNHFLQKMILYYNEQKALQFRIPPSLQKDWQS